MAYAYSEHQSNVVKREDKVLSLETRLAVPPNDVSQLEWPRYSRFILTIIDKTGKDTVYPFANIPAQDMFEIEQNIRDAHLIKSIYPFFNTGSGGAVIEDDDALSNTSFIFGIWKGKTVANVVSENPGCKDKLLEQREFLAKNAAKFPKNNILISDIDKVVKQLDAGIYTALSSAPALPTSKTIYSQPYKPLAGRCDSERRVFAYSIEIVCNYNMRYAWEIAIKNGYAPLKKMENGRNEVQVSEMVKNSSSSIKMTDAEFTGLFGKAFVELKAFTYDKFPEFYDEAQAREKKRKENAAPTAS